MARMKLTIRSSALKWILKPGERAKNPCQHSFSLGEAWVLSPVLSIPSSGESPHPYFLPEVPNEYNHNSLSNYQNDLIKPSALYLNPCNIISVSSFLASAQTLKQFLYF